MPSAFFSFLGVEAVIWTSGQRHLLVYAYTISLLFSHFFYAVLPLMIHTIDILKSFQMWDGFFALAKLNEGRRSSATLTEMKQRQSEKDAHRWMILDWK